VPLPHTPASDGQSMLVLPRMSCPNWFVEGVACIPDCEVAMLARIACCSAMSSGSTASAKSKMSRGATCSVLWAWAREVSDILRLACLRSFELAVEVTLAVSVLSAYPAIALRSAAPTAPGGAGGGGVGRGSQGIRCVGKASRTTFCCGKPDSAGCGQTCEDRAGAASVCQGLGEDGPMELKLLSDPGGWCGEEGQGDDGELDGHAGNELVDDHWLGEGNEVGLLTVSRVLPKALGVSGDSNDPVAGVGQAGAGKVLPVEVVATEPKAFPSPHALGNGVALLEVVPGIILEAEPDARKLSWLRCPEIDCDAAVGERGHVLG